MIFIRNLKVISVIFLIGATLWLICVTLPPFVPPKREINHCYLKS
jgi:hypothetical protein